MHFLWGILGIIGLLLIGFAFSKHRKQISWHTIGVGIAIQIAFAFIMLKWDFGKVILEKVSNGVQHIMNYTNEGVSFLFGNLVSADSPVGFMFALNVLPTIIFFSALMSLLYYLGIMQKVVGFLGGILSKVLKVSKIESLNSVANIFVGATEAPLVVKPYLEKVTQSQLFAIMTGGLASVAGSVLIGYSLMGVPLKYLLVASFMAAPAGLVMAKLLYPETEKKQEEEIKLDTKTDYANIFDAIAGGASDGLKLAVNVGAMLLAFIALIAMVNGIIGGIGGFFGLEGLSLEKILGYLFAPLALLIGVPFDEIVQAGGFIGQKLVLNEFVAYASFGPEVANLSPKTALVVSFALCGFANFSVIAILLGGLGNLAPSRRPEVAKLGLRAVMAATLANLLSATIAGMFF